MILSFFNQRYTKDMRQFVKSVVDLNNVEISCMNIYVSTEAFIAKEIVGMWGDT